MWCAWGRRGKQRHYAPDTAARHAHGPRFLPRFGLYAQLKCAPTHSSPWITRVRLASSCSIWRTLALYSATERSIAHALCTDRAYKGCVPALTNCLRSGGGLPLASTLGAQPGGRVSGCAS